MNRSTEPLPHTAASRAAAIEPPPIARSLEVEVPEEAAERRLDAFLAERLPELSRARLKDLIKRGFVRIGDEQRHEPAQKVKPGERFRVDVPEAAPARPAAEALPLEILHEDADLIVVVKPAGMVVHPAPGHRDGTLVNALLAHCGGSLSGVGGERRPGIVHRLDQEVSGVLVAAKHDRAHIALSAQFSLHTAHRIYEAIVAGVPATATGAVDAPIGRHPRDRLRMAVVQADRGKHAVTHFRLLETAGLTLARIEVRLETGRTHQIRVHLAHLGHPVLGDRLYGRTLRGMPAAVREASASLGRIALHARELGFVHPRMQTWMNFEAPPPAMFAELLELGRR